MERIKTIPQVNLDEELRIQEDINKTTEEKLSFVFDSGAGSGKTYALVQTIKYILKTQRERLEKNNQKVLCITYTNVAANEISKRLGNTELVKVSTIHDTLWGFISRHQSVLLTIHKEKLRKEIESSKRSLTDEKHKKSAQHAAYRSLSQEEKIIFHEYMYSVKDAYHENYNKGAADFRNSLGDGLQKFGSISNNVSKLKSIVNEIFRIDNYSECIKDIDLKKKDFIDYNQNFNSDVLHKMLISHDTLLEYSEKVFSSQPLIAKIFADKYPYILVDEYQDTNPLVIKSLELIDEQSKENNNKVVVGYFGDKAQNIYEDGVGVKLKNTHKGLKEIYKKFNRRSKEEIINVINKIRNDDITQKSIYSTNDRNSNLGGNVEFYHLHNSSNQEESVVRFIEANSKKSKDITREKVNCLVLTNRFLCQLAGFPSVYDFFSSTDYYRKFFDQVNVELLSKDTHKLGDIQLLLFKIIRLHDHLNSKVKLSAIISEELISQSSSHEIINLLNELSCFKKKSITSIIKSLFAKYEESSSQFKILINDIFDIEIRSYNDFLLHISSKLFNLNEMTEQERELKLVLVENFLKSDLKQLLKWYNHITDNVKGHVIFHTYHGTKGVEFDNVVIIMENRFGVRQPNKFKDYFMNLGNEDTLDLARRETHENTKNLLYVSCSRARKNLSILYLDDISSFKSKIETIFSTTNEFS